MEGQGAEIQFEIKGVRRICEKSSTNWSCELELAWSGRRSIASSRPSAVAA